MNTRLTKEDQAIIKKARRNKCSGPIYSEDGLRLLKVLGKDLSIFVMWCCQHLLSTWAKELSQAATNSSR